MYLSNDDTSLVETVFCWVQGELGDDCMTDVDCDEAIEHSQCLIISSNVNTFLGTCVCRDGFRQVGLLQCRYCE